MQALTDLLNYAIDKNLITERDRIYCQNQILALLHISDIEELKNLPCANDKTNIDELLAPFIQLAADKKVIQSTHPDYADLFDTAIMGALSPLPSMVQNHFDTFTNSKDATDYLFNLNVSNNYIRINRINKNIKWRYESPYGQMEISINLSKPEKDPKSIADQQHIKTSSYPKCFLCKENEGYAGTLTHPARQNIRTAEISLGNTPWFIQYSPYTYYEEHSIVFDSVHRPLEVSRQTFSNLLEFVDKYPHYMAAANTDIPIVGGSILVHEHFQSGRYKFPIENAKSLKSWKYKDIEVQQINWTMNIIRLKTKNKEQLVELSNDILEYWIGYDDPSLGIYKNTNGERHNAITPFARHRDEYFVMDLTLRNNITSEEFPDGVFHPHKDKHHIKHENIGVIEVMGLAVLPARLLEEIKIIKSHLLTKDLSNLEESCEKHKPWMEKLLSKYSFTKDNIDTIIQDEIGVVYYTALEDCKVIKDNNDFASFISNMLDNLNK